MSTRVLVSDSNVLIDFDCCDLLDAMFRLPFTFIVPDVLYIEELREQHSDLPAKGLLVQQFGPEVSADIVSLRRKHRRPSFNDLMALALARSLGCELLSGDAELRRTARAEDHPCRGSVRVLEKLVQHRQIPVEDALKALVRMKESGRRLPWGAAEKSIRASEP